MTKTFLHRKVEPMMYQARKRTQPPLPISAGAFAAALADPGNQASSYNTHYRASVTADNNMAIIFMSDFMITRASEVEQCFYDGTFFTVPTLFHQLFTLHGLFHTYCLPIAMVLMTGRSEALYSEVMCKIQEIIPNFVPLSFMGDFEVASRNAVQFYWPDAQVGGCQFHMAQAIWKKTQKLGLSEAYKNVEKVKEFVKLLMALPFLPENEIPGVVDSLFSEEHQVENSTKVLLNKLKSYFTHYWMGSVTPKHFSVFNFEHSTNNFCESFHSRLKARVKSHHPSVWTFMSHLNNFLTDATNELKRIDEGLPLTRRRKKSYQANLEKRKRCKEKFCNATYTPMQFLRALSHTCDSNLLLLENRIEERLDLGTEADDDNTPPEAAAGPQAQQHPLLQCATCLGPRERTIVFLPCRHGQICPTCNEELLRRRAPCPICRQEITDRFEVYLGVT